MVPTPTRCDSTPPQPSCLTGPLAFFFYSMREFSGLLAESPRARGPKEGKYGHPLLE